MNVMQEEAKAVNAPIATIHYAMFTANVWNFMPEIPPSEYPRLHREVLDHQQAAVRDYLEESADSLDQVLGWDDEHIRRLRAEPGIICTYHTGSYRLINKMLVRSGIPFSLLVSEKVYKEECASLSLAYQRLASQPDTGGFNLLNAEDPYVVRHMLAALEQGRNVLVYLDGNTGSGEMFAPNRINIPFLNGLVVSRMGIAAVAYLADKPIYPIGCVRSANGITSHNHHLPIYKDRDENKQGFIERTMVNLYSILENQVRYQPGDWECWLYMHYWVVPQWLTPDRFSDAHQRYGDESRWQEVYHNGAKYRLDREMYQCYPYPE